MLIFYLASVAQSVSTLTCHLTVLKTDFRYVRVRTPANFFSSEALFLPLHIKCEGVLWSLLSVCVCVCVCHFVCKHNNSRTNQSILMKFGQIVYNHNRKVKFEDGLCPLIFKVTAIKKPLEMMKISHYQSYFQHIDVKFAH